MSGYVYIAQNEYFPDLVKIGQTTDLDARLKNLNASTATPGRFSYVYHVKTENHALLEQNTHALLEAQRLQSNKEFFKITPEDAKNLLVTESEREIYSISNNPLKEKIKLKKEYFKDLPAVLTKNELLRMTEKTDKVLKIYINRWLKSGVLKQAGKRSGMYYNLVADPNWGNHILEAVEKKFPSAILAGPSVLHAHGYQTQIPKYFYVAVLSQRSMPELEQVKWMPRNRKWFIDHIPEETLYGLRSLNPKQALEDGLAHQDDQDAWVPDMDEIDMDEIDMDEIEEHASTTPQKRQGLKL